MPSSIEIQHFFRRLAHKSHRLPLSFTLELTGRCNLNCRHCYINLPSTDATAQEKELKVTSILEIARQAVDLGSVWCLLTGGEPLLRKDFSEIFLGLKKLGLLVSVFTNGTLLRKEHIELFASYPPRDIEITVYGTTQQTYERITRSEGSYKRFSYVLNLLKQSGIPIRLKAVALQSNFHEIQSISEFCRTHTKDFIRIDPHLHLRYDRNPLRNKEILEERLSAEQIVTLEKSDKKKMKALQASCAKLTEASPRKENSTKLLRCGAGNSSFTVGYNGQFRLCPALCAPRTTCNLRDTPLIDAWEKFIPSIKQLGCESIDDSQTCGDCPLLNLCMCCPAHTYLETGQLEGKVDYFCEVAHRRAENIKKKAV